MLMLARRASASANPHPQPVVQLDCGSQVRGSHMEFEGHDIHAFQGLRYAEKPPRFAPPKESICDPNVLDIDATTPGSMCAQAVSVGLNLSPTAALVLPSAIYVLPLLACFFSLFAGLVACKLKSGNTECSYLSQPLSEGDQLASAKKRLLSASFWKSRLFWGFVIAALLTAMLMLVLPTWAWSGMVGDEDCLFVNVFVPFMDTTTSSMRSLAEEPEPLPVMVWIHGGAYMVGTGRLDDPTYGSSLSMPAAGVVHVTLNYRLSSFGFLYLDDGEMEPNLGLQDQIMALRWVNKNIHSFGGDPDRIMVYGHSAGGESVMALQRMPAAKGLFHAAAALSPLPRIGTTPANAAAAWQKVIRLAGCSDRNCLQGLSTSQLANLNLLAEASGGAYGSIPDPTIPNGRTGIKFVIADGQTLTENWAVDVPMLISGCREEGDFTPPYEGLPAWPLNRTSFGDWAKQAGIPADEVWPLYSSAETPRQKYNQIGTDLTLFCGLRADAENAIPRTSPMYVNIFGYAVPFISGIYDVQYAAEGIDIWLTWGTFTAPLGLPVSAVSEKAKAAGDRFRSYLVSFARTAGRNLGNEWKAIPAVCEYDQDLRCSEQNTHAQACKIYDKKVGRKFDIGI